MPEVGPTGVFKTPDLPLIPDDITPGLRTYLNQLNDLLLTHISPAMWVNDRLYELDGLCGHRDAGFDFSVGDLTTDGDWHYLDLSSIIGKREASVTLFVYVVDDVASSIIKFRSYGHSVSDGEAYCVTPAANVGAGNQFSIKTNSDGVIEYNASNLTWTTISIEVVSWRPVYVIGG